MLFLCGDWNSRTFKIESFYWGNVTLIIGHHHYQTPYMVTLQSVLSMIIATLETAWLHSKPSDGDLIVWYAKVPEAIGVVFVRLRKNHKKRKEKSLKLLCHP